ncbi:efflux RND transporter periplasmic adaptor subunit [Clostridium sp. AWRP]|uniref:efflux RND transporter periplasmic adaptor subunit n=1 Tax=Clostridium sp. AWRP TaxID=2212991 RepID=UPI000FDB5282|nr:efflux RND transporter periplasmic adaptor subunit [Clostridium sp. AWRP]AZV57178.1 efflux RND transporter periplasmic adaptor subunit [Clostridium sp. AWRP]
MKKSILFCLILVIGLSGCSTIKSTKDIKSSSISVINKQDVFIMAGKITTDNSVDVTSNISGRVSEISTELGKKVSSGDMIIKLDTSDLQSRVDQAQSAVSTAQSNLNNAQKNPLNTADVSQYQSQLIQAQAELKNSQTSLKDATITAPISGMVSSKNVNVGDMVIPGKKLISIVDNSKLYVNAYVPTNILNQIQVGQSVNVKVPDLSEEDEFKGKIAVINSKVDTQSSNVLVKITFDSKNKGLKPGMFAEVGLK